MHLMTIQERTPVLLTGATGMIGGELLRALVDADLGRVSTLVRPGAHGDVRGRIEERFKRSGFEANGAMETIDVVAGDLRSPGLGIAPAEAERLRGQVQMILHLACETSFIRGKSCRQTNIEGMRHMLDFARTCVRPPLFVYISTATNGGAVSHCSLREEDGCKPDAQHHNEYTHSKAVAEQMLWDSGLPALVLRPSIVFSAGLPDWRFARMVLWFVPLLSKLGGVPIDPASRVDAVPVSFVVDSTIRLLTKPDRQHNCYHLSAGTRGAMTCGEIGDFLNAYYERTTPLQTVPPNHWTRELHRRYISGPEKRVAFATLKHYLPFLNMDVVYDNSRLEADLGEEAVRVPRFTSYMGELLALIPNEAVLEEAYNR
jgi:nucleoside-diphosphate-sugar epimerase